MARTTHLLSALVLLFACAEPQSHRESAEQAGEPSGVTIATETPKGDLYLDERPELIFPEEGGALLTRPISVGDTLIVRYHLARVA